MSDNFCIIEGRDSVKVVPASCCSPGCAALSLLTCSCLIAFPLQDVTRSLASVVILHLPLYRMFTF